jgi:hypothetical protein
VIPLQQLAFCHIFSFACCFMVYGINRPVMFPSQGNLYEFGNLWRRAADGPSVYRNKEPGEGGLLNPLPGASMPKFYTPAQLAEILHYNRVTISLKIKSGEIPAVRPSGKIKGRVLIPAEYVEQLSAAAMSSSPTGGK